jgi:hypothetical protein
MKILSLHLVSCSMAFLSPKFVHTGSDIQCGYQCKRALQWILATKLANHVGFSGR